MVKHYHLVMDLTLKQVLALWEWRVDGLTFSIVKHRWCV